MDLGGGIVSAEDAFRSVVWTIVAFCWLLAASALWEPVVNQLEQGGQRHAVGTLPVIIWQQP